MAREVRHMVPVGDRSHDGSGAATVTAGERAALNRAFADLCRILKPSLRGAWQLRLNINEDNIQSWEEKNHRRVQVDSAVDSATRHAHT